MDKLYFKRQIELWGEEKQESLAHRRIALIGCGGLGCSIGLALGASGIGHIDLVDFDTVSIHNVHRQIALKISDEGRYKCDVLKETLMGRYDGAEINAYTMRLGDYCALNKELDLIIDCTDNLPTRAAIDEYAKLAKTPWLYASVEEWHGQVCLFEHSSYTSSFVVNDRKPAGIAAPIVMFIASFSANIALRYLLGEGVPKDVLHYFYFDGVEFSVQQFKLPKERAS